MEKLITREILEGEWVDSVVTRMTVRYEGINKLEKHITSVLQWIIAEVNQFNEITFIVEDYVSPMVIDVTLSAEERNEILDFANEIGEQLLIAC